MEEEVMNEVKKFTLPKGKVTVRLVDRPRGAIKDPKHIMYNMVPGATFDFCARNIKGQSVIDCPLSPEEIEFFENKKKSGMSFNVGDLSPHKDKDNFWRSKKARVRLNDKPKVFDLSVASDYLDVAILKSNTDFIAPSASDEFKKKTYVYVIISEDEVIEKETSKGDKLKRAWKIAGKIEDSHEKMIDFLTVVGRRPSSNSKLSFLRAEITKEIENNINRFLEILEDPQYDTQVLLTKAVQCKAVTRDGYKYFLPSGDPLCAKGEINNFQNALNFLDDDMNQDIRLSLLSKINKGK